MKNITKTTKTILFASLIAALILPFSGMNFAEAKISKVEINQLEINQIAKETLKQLKKMETEMNDINTIKSETDELNMERLKLAIQLQELKIVGKENSEIAQKFLERLDALNDPYVEKETTAKDEIDMDIEAVKDVLRNLSREVTDIETLGPEMNACDYTADGHIHGTITWYPTFSKITTYSYYPEKLCIMEQEYNRISTSATFTDLSGLRAMGQCDVFISSGSQKTIKCDIGESSRGNMLFISATAMYDIDLETEKSIEIPSWQIITY